MLIVPVRAVPNQTLQVVLANQSCVLHIWQAPSAMFVDLNVSNAPIILGAIAQNLNRIVRSLYLGFNGDFWFADTQGTSDPDYTGLGSRFLLQYLEASDLPIGIG